MQVLILHRQLEEELELRVVLENAVEHVSGPLTTTYPQNLPIPVRAFTQGILMSFRLFVTNLSFNHSPSHAVSPCLLSSLQSSAAIIGSVQL
jgi:hypothetical protein